MIYVNPSNYFQYFRFNNSERQKILLEYFEKLRNLPVFLDPTNEVYYRATPLALLLDIDCVSLDSDRLCRDLRYQPRSDFQITPSTEEKAGTQDSPITVQIIDTYPLTYMYVSDNRTLQFMKGDDLIAFDLIRIKINFNLVFSPTPLRANPASQKVQMNIGGELLDISIPKDESVSYLFDQLDFSTLFLLEDTPFYFKPTIPRHSVRAYSNGYLYEDLFQTLFHFQSQDYTMDKIYGNPWDDEKYTKRIARLYFLAFVDLFEYPDMTLQEKIDLLKYLQDDVYSLFQSPSSMMMAHFSEKLDSLFNKELKDRTELIFYNLLTHLSLFSEQDSVQKDPQPFVDMMTFIADNNTVCLDSLLLLQQFILSQTTKTT